MLYWESPNDDVLQPERNPLRAALFPEGGDLFHHSPLSCTSSLQHAGSTALCPNALISGIVSLASGKSPQSKGIKEVGRGGKLQPTSMLQPIRPASAKSMNPLQALVPSEVAKTWTREVLNPAAKGGPTSSPHEHMIIERQASSNYFVVIA